MNIDKMLKKKIPIEHENRKKFKELLNGCFAFVISLIYFELLLRTQVGYAGVVWSLVLNILIGIGLGAVSKWLGSFLKRNVRIYVNLVPTVFYIAQIISLKHRAAPFCTLFIDTSDVHSFNVPFNTKWGFTGWMILLFAPVIIMCIKELLNRFVEFPVEIKEEIRQYFKYFGLYSAAIIYWEILLLTQIGFEGMTLYFLLFVPAWASVLSALTGWFKEKYNRIISPIVMLIPCAYYLAQLIYYRIFGSLFSVSMMGMAEDAATDFSWALMSTVKESWLWIIICLLPVIVTVVAAIFVKKEIFKGYRHYLHGAAVLKSVALWMAAAVLLGIFGMGDGTAYQAYHSNLVDTDTASHQLGALTNSAVETWVRFFGSQDEVIEENSFVPITPPSSVVVTPSVDSSPNMIEGIDFAELKGKTTNKKIQELCDYFSSVTPTNKNEYTGKFKDYNLIYICAESFSKYAIHPDVTPTLYKMSQGGIVLNNYYNSYKNTTTNGEFSFMTGLWPDVSRHAKNGTAVGSFAQSSDKLIPYTLGNLFTAKGVKSLAFHNYYGYYYRRSSTHPNLGYTSRFMSNKKGDGGMKFSTRWPASDLEMIEQSVDDYINEEQFNAYYMTFSGHGPYAYENPICAKNVEKVRKLVKGSNLTEGAKHYLAANMELDLAMEELLKRLEAAGKLETTLIVITADHYPYYLIDSTYNSLAGEKVEANFGKYESSCIMYCAGIDPVQVDTPCCNVDILPTVLNLFGLEYDSRLLPGVDIFSDSPHMAQLYNKSFITNKVKYNAQRGTAEWADSAADMTEQQKKEYLEYFKSLAKSRYAVSLEMMDTDFFRFIEENS